MYLLEIHCDNAKHNNRNKFTFRIKNDALQKWTILPATDAGYEWLCLTALSTSPAGLTSRLSFSVEDHFKNAARPLHIEARITRHFETEGSTISPLRVGAGVHVSADGEIRSLANNECTLSPISLKCRKIRSSSALSPYLILAYGPDPDCHCGTDVFDFTDPLARENRYRALFDPLAKLTDPAAFLSQLQHKGLNYKRFPPLQTIQALTSQISRHLDIDTAEWMSLDCDYAGAWRKLPYHQKRMLIPVLDAARHMADAFPRKPHPLAKPGVILLHRPDLLCPHKMFPRWIEMMDALFPNIQFVMTLSGASARRVPAQAAQTFLPIPDDVKTQESPQKPAKIPPGAILLIQVDGKLPNLALMKLSRYFKEQGKPVILRKQAARIRSAEAAFASCIYNFSIPPHTFKALKKYYGDAITIGGSGVDLALRLGEEIERLPADYDLYPKLENRAMGFITRGCPFACPFCIVPVKEGKPRQVSDIKTLMGAGRKKLILLDDNILAHPRAGDFLEEMASRDLQVNFTQTLDIRLIDKNNAPLLRRINCANTRFTRPNWHFSLNNAKNFDKISRAWRLLGFTPRDNVEFVCMYGYNTTLAEDVARFRFLKSLPGAYVFVQEYRPIAGGPAPDVADFFDHRADELIDELVGIMFSQNMRNVENYYRWVSRLYAETFGKLHQGLVDTIFRYNHRHKKGKYIATLAGTRKLSTPR